MAPDKEQTGGGQTEIIITGFGGQGIILAGNILGKAATLYDRRHATLIQSYGPEARGGACAAQVVISGEEIEYPYVETPGLLICMSQEGFTSNIGKLDEKGSLFIDTGLVDPDPELIGRGIRVHGIGATSLAEEMGVRMMANIIMLGFVTSLSGVVSREALVQAVTSSVPKGTEKKNLAGLEAGFEKGNKVKSD